jgi:glycerophosphoryl diester phosphodiesterase
VGERVPTLAAALEAMLPHAVPLIEHKAGPAQAYVDELRRLGLAEQCIVQSFDWDFVAAVHRLAPEIALAVLGPIEPFPFADDATIAAAHAAGAGMVHWHDRALRGDQVTKLHAAGLLVCTYTTDDEVGWVGGAQLGFDAMCTNDPTRMLALQREGRLQRPISHRS